MIHKPKAYAPRGTSKAKTIQMRLLPAERREFEQLCAQHGGSESRMARSVYLAGLQVWREQQAATA